MKYTFIAAKSKRKITLPKKFIETLPRKIALFTTVQFIESLQGIQKSIEQTGREVKIIKAPHSVNEGQLLGCGITEIKDVDVCLFVGDGKFHPLTLLVKNDTKVICYDPFTNEVSELTKKNVEVAMKKEKAGYVKFLASDNIGVLISMKPGQHRPNLSKMLKEKFPEKNFYFFLFDQLDFTQLDNFPFVDTWVNTACPRIMIDDAPKFRKAVINIERLLELLMPGEKIPPR